jgi:hypothetical protein
MNKFPISLEEAVSQAKEATLAALADGYNRVQVELVIPEITLQAQALALEFTTIFAEYGSGLKVMFPDSGAAALAKRDWGEVPFHVTDLGSRFTAVETQVSEQDQIFIVVAPAAIEVEKVEKLCNVAEDRPVVLLIPQLEDITFVGIGYTARQLRERFIKSLYSCYYLRPLEKAAILRCHPSQWQIWLEQEEEYQLAIELANQPIGEDLERLLMKLTNPNPENKDEVASRQKPSFLGNLQKFIRTLSQ